MNQVQYLCPHGVTVEYDPLWMGFRVTHGSNREAQMLITDNALMRSRHRYFGFRVVRRWIARIHAYEEKEIGT